MSNIPLPHGNLEPRVDPLIETIVSGNAFDLFPPESLALVDADQQRRVGNIRLAAAGLSIATLPIMAQFAPVKTARAAYEGRLPANLDVPSPTVFIIGDSTGVGLGSPGGIVDKMTNAGVGVDVFDVTGSRPLVQPGCDLPNPTAQCLKISDGVRVLEAYPEQAAKTTAFLIDLGINDRQQDFVGNLERVVRRANELGGTDGVKPLIMVPDMIYTAGYAGGKDAKNQLLYDTVSRLQAEDIKVEVIGLNGVVDVALSSDGIHPTGQGYKTEADALVMLAAPRIMDYQKSLYPVEQPAEPAAPIPVVPPTPPVAETPPTPVIPAELPVMLHAGGDIATPRTPTLTDIVAVPNKPAPELIMLHVDSPISRIDPPAPSRQEEPNPLQPVLLNVPPPTAEAGVAIDYDMPKLDEIIVPDKPVLAELPNPTPDIPSTEPVIPSVDNMPDPAETASFYPDNLSGREDAEILMPIVSEKGWMVSSGYAEERKYGGHSGIDLTGRNPSGYSDILSGVDGVILEVDRVDDSDAGLNVIIGTHLTSPSADEDGDVFVQHRELTDLSPDIAVGDVVAPDTIIGGIGHGRTSGSSEGPHDHLQVYALNPLEDPRGSTIYATPGYTLDPTDIGFREPDGRGIIIDGRDVSYSDPPVETPPVEATLPDPVPVEEPDNTIIPIMINTGDEQDKAPTRGILPDLTDIVTPDLGEGDSPTTTPGTSPLPPLTDIVDEPGPTQPDDKKDKRKDKEDKKNKDNPNVPAEEPAQPDNSDPVQPEPTVPVEPPIETPEPTAPPTEVPVEPELPVEQPPVAELPVIEEAPIGEDGLRGFTVPEKIYNFYIDAGYTLAGTAGLMGNFADESGLQPGRPQIAWKGETCTVPPPRLNPKVRDPDSGGTKGMGFGLAQWTTTSRQEGLQAYADSKGVAWTDLRTQLEYTLIELQSSYFKNVDDVLRTTDSIEAATEIVVRVYETPQPYTNGDIAGQQETLRSRTNAAYGINDAAASGAWDVVDVACDGVGPN